MKIKITDEMMEAAMAIYALADGHTAGIRAVLERGFLVAERDYVISGGPVPDDVIQVKDRSGDVWDKLADGRWVCISQWVARPTIADVRGEYGPLTW